MSEFNCKILNVNKINVINDLIAFKIIPISGNYSIPQTLVYCKSFCSSTLKGSYVYRNSIKPRFPTLKGSYVFKIHI
jgi:hypothetical protein